MPEGIGGRVELVPGGQPDILASQELANHRARHPANGGILGGVDAELGHEIHELSPSGFELLSLVVHGGKISN
jgi:hypothetical protein